jgi:hypothetical protein
MVACKGGAGLIGGVTVAGGSQGQDLPAALAGLLQKVNEGEGLLAHGTHTIGTGQGCDVHQNATFTHSKYSLIKYFLKIDGCEKFFQKLPVYGAFPMQMRV